MAKNPLANAGDTRDEGSIPGSGRSLGEGYGNALQYSCLENPMDGGAWWTTIHGVTELYMTEVTAHKHILHVCTPQQTVSSLRAGWTLLAGSLPAQRERECVCVRVHMHACVHACVFTAWLVCVCVCVCVRARTCMHACTHVCSLPGR